jgi:hypothetical protein
MIWEICVVTKHSKRLRLNIILVCLAILFIFVLGCGKVVSQGINDVAYSANGHRIFFIEGVAAGTIKSDYHLYSANIDKSGKKLILDNMGTHNGPIIPSPDGKYIAVLDLSSLKIIRVSDNYLLQNIGGGPIMTYGWDPSAKYFWYSSDVRQGGYTSFQAWSEQEPVNGLLFVFDIKKMQATQIGRGLGLDMSERFVCSAVTSAGARYDFDELRVADRKTGDLKLLFSAPSGTIVDAKLSKNRVYCATNLKNDGSSEIDSIDLMSGKSSVVWKGSRVINSMNIVKKMVLDEKRNRLIFSHGEYGQNVKAGISVINLNDNSVEQVFVASDFTWTYSSRTGKAIIKSLGQSDPYRLSEINIR